MMRTNEPLANTLQLTATADRVVDVTTPAAGREAFTLARELGLPLRGLGEGSNVVLSERVSGMVCRVRNADVTVIRQDQDHVWVEVGAGKNWHEFVLESLAQGWFGLENLALIPGSVGAAPVQNIGAYGVEVAQFIESVWVFDADGGLQSRRAMECDFGYRDSCFKRSESLIGGLSGQIIYGVRFRLNRRSQVNLSYQELAQTLGVADPIVPETPLPSPQEVAEAVMTIRQRKLPDPQSHPNAGSFFKNPVVSPEEAHRLRGLGLQPYAFDQLFKVSAAQMIDTLGWKERRDGPVACWPLQPLVLVNVGQATAAQVLDFASDLQRSVYERFQLYLELEPSVVS